MSTATLLLSISEKIWDIIQFFRLSIIVAEQGVKPPVLQLFIDRDNGRFKSGFFSCANMLDRVVDALPREYEFPPVLRCRACRKEICLFGIF